MWKFTKKNNNGGEDLYPRLKKIAEDIVTDKKISSRSLKKDNESDKILHEKVRYEILRRFGYFVTESSEHFAEYVPWFIKSNRQDLIDKYKIPIEEYIDRCEKNVELWNNLEKDMTPIYNQSLKRSNEYASYIMDAVVNNKEVKGSEGFGVFRLWPSKNSLLPTEEKSLVGLFLVRMTWA